MSEWISVKDRLPVERGAVLVWESERQNEFTAILETCSCRHCPGHWIYFGIPAAQQIMQEVTHWMPLPAPPESEAK